MQIQTYAGDYARRRDICKEVAGHLRRAANRFTSWCHNHGHQPDTRKLTEAIVSEWVAFLVNTGSRPTAWSLRKDLITLWRAAAQERLAKKPDTELIRPVKLPPTRVHTWRPDERKRLMLEAEKLQGYLDYRKGRRRGIKIPAREFAIAAIMFGYETGFRRGDLLDCRLADIDQDAFTVAIIQNKTRKDARRPISPATLNAIWQLDHPDGLVLPWLATDDAFSRWFKRLVVKADLPGTPKWLRKTCATEIWLANPGAETQALGHVSDACDKYYKDTSRQPAGVLPPALVW